jgi:hypothetical protein
MLGGTDRKVRGLVEFEPDERGARRYERSMDGGLSLAMDHMVPMVVKPGGHGRLCGPVP